MINREYTETIKVAEYDAASNVEGSVTKKYKAKRIFENKYFIIYEYFNSKGEKRKHTFDKRGC